MPIIPYWYTMSEIERRACFMWEFYEHARIHNHPDRDKRFESYMFWRMRLMEVD